MKTYQVAYITTQELPSVKEFDSSHNAMEFISELSAKKWGKGFKLYEISEIELPKSVP